MSNFKDKCINETATFRGGDHLSTLTPFGRYRVYVIGAKIMRVDPRSDTARQFGGRAVTKSYRIYCARDVDRILFELTSFES